MSPSAALPEAPAKPSVLDEMRALVGLRGEAITGPDPVNAAMVRHWCAALGDRNPVYRDDALARRTGRPGAIAPPAMLQAWVMPGYAVSPPAADPVARFHALADAHGYASIVATNCEQTYLRELRTGDSVRLVKVIEAVSDEKQTALGAGIFLTTRFEFTDGQGELVARMLHRVLRFRPGGARAGAVDAVEPVPPARRPRPNLSPDIAFYFEAAKRHRLEIQRCTACQRLRHPPTAACAHCGGLGWDTVAAAGAGRLYSFTVVHAPVVPPFKPPYVVGLVELDEGVRVVTEITGVAPHEMAIGMPLRLAFLHCDEEMVLPVFRPRAELDDVMQGEGLPPSRGAAELHVGDRLAPLALPITRSFIVASAIATRDYQAVHHDPEVARRGGSKDVFVNILTTTGLVGRFATDALGPAWRLRSIAIRLGATAYPGDTLSFGGSVTAVREVEGLGLEATLDITGSLAAGQHVTAQVTALLPHGDAA